MASLSLEHVGKKYPNGYEGVKDFNLEIADKEFIIFVGPSGCGKSTTLRMIAGLEDITSGTFKIDGQVMNDVEPKDRDIAMVFQNYALYPHMTVRDNMGFALKLKKVPEDQINKAVDEAARILGLEALLGVALRALLFVGFAIVLPALGMAENGPLAACRNKHVHSNFTCIGAALMISAVLGGEFYFASLEGIGYAAEMRERRSNDKSHIIRSLSCKFNNCFRKGDTFGNGSVHLPVAGYDFLSHFLFVFIRIFNPSNLRLFFYICVQKHRIWASIVPTDLNDMNMQG